jgi:outer membrane immunogenic protein
MWRRVVVGLILSLLATGPGMADEKPVYSWSGLYIGLHAGYGGQSATSGMSGDETVAGLLLQPGAATYVPQLQSLAMSLNGFFGGGQIGYNFRAGSSIVLGLEADLSGTGIDSLTTTSVARALPGGGIDTLSVSLNSRVNWLATFRARTGLLVTDRLLFYAAGGLAWGWVEDMLALTHPTGADVIAGNFACAAQSTCLSGSTAHSQLGWTVGGGLEYALTSNVSFRGDYMYVDLGSRFVPQRRPLKPWRC